MTLAPSSSIIRRASRANTSSSDSPSATIGSIDRPSTPPLLFSSSIATRLASMTARPLSPIDACLRLKDADPDRRRAAHHPERARHAPRSGDAHLRRELPAVSIAASIHGPSARRPGTVSGHRRDRPALA